MSRPYRPSCGTEGADFQAHFCELCTKDAKYRETLDGEDGCPILASTLFLPLSDPRYPKEWVQDEQGARCTAFEAERGR